MEKLFCYVDETGQDHASEIFVVVAVVSNHDQSSFRKALMKTEAAAKTGQRKWHKSKPERRLKYLEMIIQKNIGKGEVYYGRYKKPLPYFLPILETLEKAITCHATNQYRAIIHIDGIDRKKAAELTNALRLRHIILDFVKSRRDESEPVIRLADMWAGCIRHALRGNLEAEQLFLKAKSSQYLISIN